VEDGGGIRETIFNKRIDIQRGKKPIVVVGGWETKKGQRDGEFTHGCMCDRRSSRHRMRGRAVKESRER
jgi:hypothetical protein